MPTIMTHAAVPLALAVAAGRATAIQLHGDGRATAATETSRGAGGSAMVMRRDR